MKIQPVMLAEGLRTSPLELLVGMPPQLLPITPSASLLTGWHEKLTGVFRDLRSLEILVASSEGYRSMESLARDGRFKRIIDPRSHRGTGGVLADYLKIREADDQETDYLIVIDRTSCPPRSLDGFVKDLEARPDILVGVSELDRLAGIIAIKPRVLDLVPEIGYFDLKEQTVSKAIRSRFSVAASVIMPRAIHVRSLPDWIAAIRYLGVEQTGLGDSVSYTSQGINCIDPSAKIGKAVIIDSVIMRNAQVSDGAVIARSVVCEGAHITPGKHVIDSIIDNRINAAASFSLAKH